MHTIINSITSVRNFCNPPGWQIAFEWEEDLSDILCVKLDFYNLQNYARINSFIVNSEYKHLHPIVQNIDSNTSLVLFFSIFDSIYFILENKHNFIPIIMDFWKQDLDHFQYFFSNFSLIYTISKEIAEMANIRYQTNAFKYFPMCISKRWSVDYTPFKSVDIIQIGRINPLLHQYTLDLVKEYPEIEYVYAKTINGQKIYFSTQKGKLGIIETRNDLMNLYRMAKISLVSPPGMNNDSRNTNGIHPVSARFLESIISFCHIIGVYPENEDFNYFEMSSICNNVRDYAHFKTSVLQYLHEPFNKMNLYKHFLQKHYVEDRAKQIVLDIRNL
ncbi:MAG TPA: hypothetical protein PK816_07730 [Candidatus Cloacimonadota bacterium]|nr:hypothetical protein [Candidatus Cloacimonadota bacterium]